MGKRSKHISFFFLALLVLIKVSSLHVYAHQDADAANDHCAWCQLSLETQHQEFLFAEVAALPEGLPGLPAYCEPVAPEVFAARQIPHSERFCRPPPAIL